METQAIGVFLIFFGALFKVLWIIRARPHSADQQRFDEMASTPRRQWPAEWRRERNATAVADLLVYRWPNRISVPMVVVGLVILLAGALL